MTRTVASDRLVIANDVAELRRMTDWLCNAAAAMTASREVIDMLDFCANEAVSNIINYAYDDNAHHDITLDLHRTTEGVRLSIEDDGRPFNMLEAPEFVAPAELAEARVGGLGIHLIRHRISRCDYRRKDGCNVLFLEAHDKHPLELK